MGKYDFWDGIVQTLELNGYILIRKHLTLQFLFPDGLFGRVVRSYSQEDVIDAIEYADAHFRITTLLFEAGYTLESPSYGWRKDDEVFKDFRFAYSHLQLHPVEYEPLPFEEL